MCLSVSDKIENDFSSIPGERRARTPCRESRGQDMKKINHPVVALSYPHPSLPVREMIIIFVRGQVDDNCDDMISVRKKGHGIEPVLFPFLEMARANFVRTE